MEVQAASYVVGPLGERKDQSDMDTSQDTLSRLDPSQKDQADPSYLSLQFKLLWTGGP